MRPIRWAGVGIALLLALALFYRSELTQLWKVVHLFDADAIVYNFQHMDELFPSRTVQRGGGVLEFERGSYDLPAGFRYAGRSYDTEAFLEDTATTGLLIMRDDTRVAASITPDAPHLMPGPNPNSSSDLGYGYQWWIPPEPDGDFMALGVYGQMIYIDPKNQLIIVKNAANRDFQRNHFEPTRETLAL